MDEEILPVFERSNNLDLTYRVAADEVLEELNEAFRAVLYPGGVLGVAVTCVLGNCFARIAIPNAFEIETECVL